MMAHDIARAFFVGRLTRDIEVLFSGNGNLFGVITLAVNVYQGKNLPERTSFFRFTVPGRTVDSIGTYLTKGRQVAVDAVPVMTSWNDADGGRHTRVQFDATNIQLLAEPRSAVERREREQESDAQQAVDEVHTEEYLRPQDGPQQEARFEDDLPF
jgi:single stranded DNA-binding protein